MRTVCYGGSSSDTVCPKYVSHFPTAEQSFSCFTSVVRSMWLAEMIARNAVRSVFPCGSSSDTVCTKYVSDFSTAEQSFSCFASVVLLTWLTLKKLQKRSTLTDGRTGSNFPACNKVDKTQLSGSRFQIE